MIDLTQFRQPQSLRDGRPLLIRAAAADDRERFVTAFSQLEPQSIYTRFFGFRKSLSDAELARLDTADFDNYVALVATLGSGADEIIIAAASYVVPDRAATPRVGELAFTVEEDFQGQGLASKLLAALIVIARDRGLSRLEADVLSLNKPMLAVFERSGLPLRRSREDGFFHLVMDLEAAAAGA